MAPLTDDAEHQERQRLDADGDEDRGPALQRISIERVVDERAHEHGANHEPDEHGQGARLARTAPESFVSEAGEAGTPR